MAMEFACRIIESNDIFTAFGKVSIYVCWRSRPGIMHYSQFSDCLRVSMEETEVVGNV